MHRSALALAFLVLTIVGPVAAIAPSHPASVAEATDTALPDHIAAMLAVSW
jgi:hypothetical protein